MRERQRHAVTGAFGYTGKYIAQRLLDAGLEVISLTNSPRRRHPFGERIAAFPFRFDDPDALAEMLRGVRVLYNTYWVRFNTRAATLADALRNTMTLFGAARQAGVERIVHVSIANASADSPFEYFRGKAAAEKALDASGVSYAVVRPALLFGREDILVNNIAWALRRFPAFAIFGDGAYRLRPVHVEDLAALAVRLGEERENRTVDAVGPETFTYRELVEKVAAAIGRKRPLVHVPPAMGYLAGRVIGLLTGDVLLTRDELDGLMAGLLYVDSPATGPTRLTEWLRANAEWLGRHYASEMARRRDRLSDYAAL